MLMHNPPHPGEVLRRLCLEPLGLSVTDAAKALGVSRKTLSSILNGRAGRVNNVNQRCMKGSNHVSIVKFVLETKNFPESIVGTEITRCSKRPPPSLTPDIFERCFKPFITPMPWLELLLLDD